MKKSNKSRTIMLLIAIILVIIIVTILVTKNVINRKKINNENYLITESANSELLASYIKSGITIGGITGTLEVLDTSDATATAENISEGKIAYSNGERIIGNGVDVNNAYNNGIEQGKIDGNGKLILSYVQTTTSDFNRLLYADSNYVKNAGVGGATFIKDVNIKIVYYAFSSLWGYAKIAFGGESIVNINNTKSASTVSKTAKAGSTITSSIEGTYGAEVYTCIITQ